MLTAQKRQPRVHVSPSSITVAVPVGPFQHSPMFGHCASSQTVASLRPARSAFIASYFSPCAALCLQSSLTFIMGHNDLITAVGLGAGTCR